MQVEKMWNRQADGSYVMSKPNGTYVITKTNGTAWDCFLVAPAPDGKTVSITKKVCSGLSLKASKLAAEQNWLRFSRVVITKAEWNVEPVSSEL